MISRLAALARPLLFTLDPERAHDMAITALKTGLVPGSRERDDRRLSLRLWDLDFPNPLGMAAGFDKNGEVPDRLLDLGFGFVEVGTVAPRPQPGNPKPRVFRLPADNAVINRYGFNTKGHAAVLANLAARRPNRSGDGVANGVLAVNIGANKDSQDRTADYVAGVSTFAAHASFLTVNISSPNTPGLRDLQHEAALEDLLARVSGERDRQTDMIGRRVPLVLKIAPDLEDADLDSITANVTRHGVDGVVVSNTTLSRVGLTSANANEAGGMSGQPLFRRSTIMLARLRQRLGPDMPIIGVGGIDSGEAAYEKIRAGANLVQIYTGLIYEGIGLIEAIKRDLVCCLERDWLSNIAEAVNTGTNEWAGESIE